MRVPEISRLWRVLKSEGWRGLRMRIRLRRSDWPRAIRSKRFLVGFRSRSLDRGKSSRRVTVVVPVFGGLEALERCLASLDAHTDFLKHRLLLVDDASPDSQVVALLQQFAASQREKGCSCHLRLHEKNQGYPATANESMEFAGDDDVVLVNSDTEVTAHWLEKMIATAYSREKIASVTPFSNNATIASTPIFLKPNSVKDVEAWGRRVERLSPCLRPEIPTGVGFCILLRQEALREVGRFDAEAFGIGYGEETDWCARATAAGWIHLLEDSTFIFHGGSESFGVEQRLQRVESAEKLMEARHPSYRHRVGSFITRNPLETYHRIHAEAPEPTENNGTPRVLFLHSGPPERRFGGAEQHLRDLMEGLERRGWAVGVLYPQFDSYVLSHCLNGERSQWEMAASSLENLDYLARAFAPSLIHIQHIHGLPLRAAALGEGIPRVIALHDFEFFCPHADLRERIEGNFCGFCIDRGRCSRCLRAGGKDYSAQEIGDRRKLAENLLGEAEAVVSPSDYLADAFQRLMPTLKDRTQALKIIPHGTPGGLTRVPQHRGRKRVAFLGTFHAVKGSQHFAELVALCPEAEVEWWIIGGVEDHRTLDAIRRSTKIQTTGPYARENLGRLLTTVRPSVVVIPTPIPESWCFTLTEALLAGVPVLAYDHGAVAERLRSLDWSVGLVDLDRGPQGLAHRLQLWLQEGLPSSPKKTPTWELEAMVDSYEKVYREAMASPVVITGIDT